jgi:hypothetical protein
MLGRPIPNVPRRYFASDCDVVERKTKRIICSTDVRYYFSSSPLGTEADDAAGIIAEALDAQGVIL